MSSSKPRLFSAEDVRNSFLARLNKVWEELLHYSRLHVSVSMAISKMLKFYFKFFYVMGNALTGGLSCPCDRSCFYLLPSDTFIFHSASLFES